MTTSFITGATTTVSGRGLTHCVTVAALAMFACGGCKRNQVGSAPVKRRRPPDVLLITIDTLRADHIGCYGYKRPTSPNIDGLAADGALYENVVSASSFTGPSIASIMTGKYPRFTTFAYANAQTRLMPEEVTIAEHFQSAGYKTAAFVCNPVLMKAAGLNQGFDHYDDEMRETERVRRNYRERTAPPVTDAVIAWLATLSREDAVFLWVHYQDAHGPYTPPPEFEERFRPTEPGPELQACPEGDNLGKGCVPWYQTIDRQLYANVYTGRYDAEIAFLDHHLGRLLDALRRSDRYDRAVILLTADHGEALGENGYFYCHGHGVTRDQSFVPMILKSPRVAPGSRFRTPVGHIDIYRTLTAVIGASGHANGVGEPLDLAHVDDAAVPHRALYCDAGDYLAIHYGDCFAVGRLKDRTESVIAGLRPEDFTRILVANYPRDSIAPVHEDAAYTALLPYAARYLSAPATPFGIAERDSNLEADLRSLGYIGND